MGLYLQDTENHVIKNRVVADDNLEKKTAASIEKGQEPGFAENREGMLADFRRTK